MKISALSHLMNPLLPVEPSPPKVSYRLTGEVALPLHTKLAQVLCRGSWKSLNRMGLFQFVTLLGMMHHAAEQDDPYADLYQEKIQEELLKVSQTIKMTIAYYEQALQHWRGRLEVEIIGSQHPLKLHLEFASPLGYVAAFTLGDMDYFVRQTLTFRRLGIFPETYQIKLQLMDELRAVFVHSRQWRHTGVTRQDMREKNQIAERAKDLMGFMPSRILKQENQKEQKDPKKQKKKKKESAPQKEIRLAKKL
jgi:integrating conjugative element protein (TIGR03761 family)